MNNKTVTCSFSMDRELYNAYKSIVAGKGENVKGNIVRYMKDVIKYETPNLDTIAAIKEVEQMKNNSHIGKGYSDVDEMLQEILE